MYEITVEDYRRALQVLRDADPSCCAYCGKDLGHVPLTRGQVAALGGEAALREVFGNIFCVIKDRK